MAALSLRRAGHEVTLVEQTSRFIEVGVGIQAQGAAQAIMDAAVLGDVLAGATSAEVPDALDRYVRRRLAVATGMQAGSARAGEDFHLPDGPEARARNARMAARAAENVFMPQATAWAADVLDDQAPS